MTLTKTLLASVLAVALSVPAHAGWFDKKSSQEVKTQPKAPESEVGLGALDSEPNPLHGIDGLHQGRVPLGAVSPNTLKTFVSVVDLVRRDYVEDVNDEQLFAYAMSGMLTKLDRNAGFLDKQAYANLQSFTEGNIAGVGLTATWQETNAHWVVTALSDKSPAKKAGVSVGDYLHQIGDVKLGVSQSPNDVSQLLNGMAGTQVELTVSKEGRTKRTVSVQRSEILKSSIETVMYDDVAVIKLPVFHNNTRQQILDSISQAKPVAGIILDIRNNPGGVLESARDVASLFMRGQNVVQVVGRHGLERVVSTQGSPILIDVPVVILQNRYSASASEVLASSLQAQKRALVVGETSYGKGSVQSVIPIGANNDQAVKLTTARYLTAKGEQIDGKGVKPDVVLTMPEGVAPEQTISDVWLHQAMAIMEQGKLPVGIKFDPVGGF